MILYPAIDIFGGRVVRLARGNYARMTVYAENPRDIADEFARRGAKWAHAVDLEGARGGGSPNFGSVLEIIKSGLSIEVGGGIRDRATAEKYLEAGVKRVILGTAAASEPVLLRELARDFPDSVAVGVDIKDGFVATHGWTKVTGESCEAAFKRLADAGVKTVICTDISKDGMLAGTNLEMYARLVEETDIDIIASGGVSTLSDLSALKDIGVSGAILGRAYYEKRVSIEDALAVCGGDIA